VKYNRRARLDTSQVRDTRKSGGGRGVAIGGGGAGVLGIVIYLVVSAVGGSGAGQAASAILGQLGQNGQPATADNSEIQQACKTGEDANNKLECAVVADIDSIQAYWSAELPKLGKTYTPVKTVWFAGQVSTGCGAADSGAGPFYCPADKLVYIDLSFYDDIRSEFHANGGLFVDAYVLAHEYGHHVQDLLGSLQGAGGSTGATGSSVRTELQADCFAGVWANHAASTGYLQPLTDAQIADALDAASAVGDDRIQKATTGQVNPDSWTHGSSAQRQKWFTTGYQSGDPAACDTSGAI
jgi:predicted metalloprotease